METGSARLVSGGQKIPEGIAGANGRANRGGSLWGGATGIGGGEGGADSGGGNEMPAVDRNQFDKTAEGRPGKGEDRVAAEAGKHYDVEMDCATVADGKLDACVELPGEQREMNRKVSIVRTDPFMKLDFAYDYLGRREQKIVSVWNSSTLNYEPFHLRRLEPAGSHQSSIFHPSFVYVGAGLERNDD